MIKVLNNYASLGGNRYKWDYVAEIQVTAVENDPELIKLYKERFPNDIVIEGDAHEYLLNHYHKFDFIWSSPPCPKNSKARFWKAKGENTGVDPVYPDLRLYEEVILLEHYFEGLYCVENVDPYYTPLIPAKQRGRHLFWTNFNIPSVLTNRDAKIGSGKNEIQRLCEFHDFDFFKYGGGQRRDKIARNLVDYEAGKTIFQTAVNVMNGKNVNQIGLFDQ